MCAGSSGLGAHSFTVSGAYNAVTTREAAAEIVAVHLFGRAHEAGATITRRWVDDQLERLRSHPPDCRCNEPCGLARQVTAAKVDWTASGWQRQYRWAQVRARR
jgi:hypothetical protein